MPPVESVLQFADPNTPDLGCFVGRKHEFRIDPHVDFLNVHVEFSLLEVAIVGSPSVAGPDPGREPAGLQ